MDDAAVDAALASFERDGFAVLDPLQLPPETVTSYKASLEPWADAQMGLEPPQSRSGSFHTERQRNYWEGRTRLAASNAVLQLQSECPAATAHTLDLMTDPFLLRFAERAFRTSLMAIDSIQIACYPAVGEGGNDGHPPTTHGASTELHGWHRGK